MDHSYQKRLPFGVPASRRLSSGSSYRTSGRSGAVEADEDMNMNARTRVGVDKAVSDRHLTAFHEISVSHRFVFVLLQFRFQTFE